MIRSEHLGNGLTVWDDSIINYYLIIAHIDKDRTVTMYYSIPIYEFAQILDIAFNDDREVSITQDEKVFNKRPSEVSKILVINKFLSKKHQNYTQNVERR